MTYREHIAWMNTVCSKKADAYIDAVGKATSSPKRVAALKLAWLHAEVEYNSKLALVKSGKVDLDDEYVKSLFEHSLING